MTLSQILVSILIALLSGFVAAYLTPLFNANFARRNWRHQKAFDLKYEVFQGAVTALAAWLTDALDVNLQNSKGQYKGASRLVEMRPETSQALEKYRGMVEAFFSHEVAQKFDEATRRRIWFPIYTASPQGQVAPAGATQAGAACASRISSSLNGQMATTAFGVAGVRCAAGSSPARRFLCALRSRILEVERALLPSGVDLVHRPCPAQTVSVQSGAILRVGGVGLP
jgi:hypothetical protein